MATTEQIETIGHRRYDDTAREMEREGVDLTWDEIEEIGEMGVAWLRDRLGLVSESDDLGMTFRPRAEMA